MRRMLWTLVGIGLLAGLSTGVVLALNYEGEDFCEHAKAWPGGTYLGQMHPYHSNFYRGYAERRGWDPCVTWATDQRNSAIRGLRELGYTVTASGAPAVAQAAPSPTWTTLDGTPLEVAVVGYDADGWREMVIENGFNDPPRDGHRYLIVTVQVRNRGDAPILPSIDLHAGGRSFTEFAPESRCGVIPDSLNDAIWEKFQQVTIPAQADVTGNLCFQVPEALRNLSLVPGTLWSGEPIPVIGTEALPPTDRTGIDRQCRCQRTRVDGGCDRRFNPVMICRWVVA